MAFWNGSGSPADKSAVRRRPIYCVSSGVREETVRPTAVQASLGGEADGAWRRDAEGGTDGVRVAGSSPTSDGQAKSGAQRGSGSGTDTSRSGTTLSERCVLLCGLFARAGETGNNGQRGGTTAVCAHSECRGSVHPGLYVWLHGKSDERNRDTRVQGVRRHSVHVHTPSCREVAVHTLCNNVRRHTMDTEQRGRHPPIAKLPVGRTCIDDTHRGKGSYPVFSQDTGANHTPSVSVYT